MDEHARITEAAIALADAIGRRDGPSIRALLTPDFLLRTPGQGSADADAFIAGVQGIPGEILSVRLENLVIDLTGPSALVTGIQRAQVRINGHVVDDVRPFVDWFVQSEDRWKVRVAVDLAAQQPS